jgi:molybdate transport system regulatory protein
MFVVPMRGVNRSSADANLWQSYGYMKPRVQFRLRISRGDAIAVGPGKIDLLEAIGRTGSITAAARALGMSYRRAWLLVDTMNRCFRNAVVEAEAGGARGGGTRLTPTGVRVVAHYRRAEMLAGKAGAAELRALLKLLRS